MKISWMQDYNVFDANVGGAEMNDRAHIQAGIRRGHDIVLLTPASLFHPPDLLIVSNCTMFDRKRLSDMVHQSKTVFFFHDYIFCRHRLYYPMGDRCRDCGDRDYWLGLFLSAKLIIYLSPLHQQYTWKLLPELQNIKSCLVPSAIDPFPFLMYHNHPDRRGVLAVNHLLGFKGKENLFTFARDNPEIVINAYGQAEPTENLPSNINVLPSKLYGEMPELFSKYEYYIEIPDTPQPFNRTIVEAKLAGCRIITNKLVGATSWDWFPNIETMTKALTKAPEDFWSNVEESIK